MKGTTLQVALCGVLSTPAAAFVMFPAPTATARATSHQNGRGARLTAQLAVAVDSPSRPTVGEGKRIVRRKKEQRPAAPIDIDTTNAPVTRITSNVEYLRALRENENNLVVIKFFAPWCRSCKAMDVKYRRLATQNEDVKFYEIDVHESPELKKALGVRAVPTVKLHAGSLGQIASFTCGPRKVSELTRKMELCRDVPALAARLSKGSGMMEMVAGVIEGEQPASTSTSATSAFPEQDSTTSISEKPAGLAKGLMEKLARQEMLSQALTQQRLDDFPMESGL